jgi:hypothetical protein
MATGDTRDFTSASAERAAGFVLDHVIAIATSDSRDDPDLEGSGLIFEIGSALILVSAAHVFRRLRDGLYLLPPRSEPIDVTGSARTSFDRNQPYDLDVGFLRLSPADAVKVPTVCRTQVWNVSDQEHLARPRIYIGLGFPAARQGRDVDRKRFYLKPTVVSGMAAPRNAYAACKMEPSSHLLMTFNRHWVIAGSVVGPAPELKGISGGGIWRVNPLESYSHEHKPVLAGVITEYNAPCYPDAIHGTRVGPILSFVAKAFPELASAIPSRIQSQFRVREI